VEGFHEYRALRRTGSTPKSWRQDQSFLERQHLYPERRRDYRAELLCRLCVLNAIADEGLVQPTSRLAGMCACVAASTAAQPVRPLLFWQRIGVTTGVTPADSSTPWSLISLEPKRPSATWHAVVDAFESPSSFAARPAGAVPAIARPNGWMQSGAVASGPIVR